MIRIKKLSAMTPGYRITSRRPPQPELVLIVRGKFRIAPGQPLALVKAENLAKFKDDDVLPPEGRAKIDEGALLLGQGSLEADRFHDDDPDRAGEVVYPSDLAEFKPKCDVMLRGSCHAPRSNTTSCKVGFGVGKFYKELLVTGPRVWVDKVAGGKASEPLAFEKLPIGYRHAFGGPRVPDNPCGTGHESERLPIIEDPKRPVTRAGEGAKPVGFGPINPLWPLRKDKLGKNYGEEYERTRAPWYASDYDWTAQNSAPVDQQLDHFLAGDEPVRFLNLHPEARDFTVDLPGVRPRAFAMLRGGVIAEAPLVLDTLFADLDESVIYLTWRGHIPVAEDDLSDVEFLLYADEVLAEKPRPAAEYEEELRAFAEDPIGLKDNPASKLAELEEKLESGELDREIDAGNDPITPLLSPVADKMPGGDKMIAQIQDAMARTVGKNAAAKAALTEQVKGALRSAFDGPSMPRLVVRDKGPKKGTVEAGPMFKRMLRDAQSTPGADKVVDPEEMKEQLQDQIRDLGLPGIDADDVQVPENLGPPDPEPGADFSGCDLTNRSYAGLDLKGCNFDGAILRRANFEGCDLSGSTFRGAALARTKMNKAIMRGVDLTSASLSRVDLREADLSEADLEQCSLTRCDLMGAKMRKSKGAMIQFERCDLSSVDLSWATWDKCILNDSRFAGLTADDGTFDRSFFRGGKMEGARFRRTSIDNVTFLDCELTGASFVGAVGATVNFQQSVLENADFSYAKIPKVMMQTLRAAGARFLAADMPEARFYRSVLRKANLESANLLQADMRKVVISDADFRKSNCFQAAFAEAHGVDADFRKANLEGANFKRSELVKKS